MGFLSSKVTNVSSLSTLRISKANLEPLSAEVLSSRAHFAQCSLFLKTGAFMHHVSPSYMSHYCHVRVDNNGVRHNCTELLNEFESDVAAAGRIYLHREGDTSSFLSELMAKHATALPHEFG